MTTFQQLVDKMKKEKKIIKIIKNRNIIKSHSILSPKLLQSPKLQKNIKKIPSTVYNKKRILQTAILSSIVALSNNKLNETLHGYISNGLPDYISNPLPNYISNGLPDYISNGLPDISNRLSDISNRLSDYKIIESIYNELSLYYNKYIHKNSKIVVDKISKLSKLHLDKLYKVSKYNLDHISELYLDTSDKVSKLYLSEVYDLYFIGSNLYDIGSNLYYIGNNLYYIGDNLYDIIYGEDYFHTRHAFIEYLYKHPTYREFTQHDIDFINSIYEKNLNIARKYIVSDIEQYRYADDRISNIMDNLRRTQDLHDYHKDLFNKSTIILAKKLQDMSIKYKGEIKRRDQLSKLYQQLPYLI